MEAKKHYFVDLFAGCGGLSLGLEQAGFIPILVNELNKDAMETYLLNRDAKHPLLRKKYNVHDVKRLVLEEDLREGFMEGFKEDFGIDISKGELDLLVGGPPCQGYSGIGHRRSYSVDRKQLPSNHLYQDMAALIHDFQPKVFLFENVRGLLNARWTKEGRKGEIWDDVFATFNNIPEYDLEYRLVHAKDYGVPQNRPRILIVGVRKDVLLEKRFKKDESLRAMGFLPEEMGGWPHVKDIFSDLVDDNYVPGQSETNTYKKPAKNKWQRYYRARPDGGLLGKGSLLTEQEYSNHAPHIIEKFEHMIMNGGEIPERFQTKKFAQRVLPEIFGNQGPKITTTSLPDDFVHYCQPRSVTVREWARLQTFPDWYQFAGKRTTGGTRRAGNPREGNFDREVPKYTQIGNAVPVLMARAVGEHFLKTFF